MGINDLFDIFSRQKRRAKANMARRLADIKKNREAAEGASRGRGGRLDVRTPSEKQADAARKGSANILRNELGRFLYLGEPVTGFRSSCVKSFWYEVHSKILHIQFKDQSIYGYGSAVNNISVEMAASLFRSKSKGSWIWDNLRIRKTKLGHRVEYRLETAPPGGRAYQRSPEAEAAHHEQVEAESQYGAYASRFERQNVGRGEPEMRAPRSKKARDLVNPETGKVRLPEP